MKRVIPILTLILLLSNSCKKDLDFDKFKTFNLQPELGFPIGIINLTMSDLIKEDSNIVYDGDGFIRFVLSNDTVASFPVDSFVKIPDIAPIQINNSLGLIDVTDITITQTKSLNDMMSGFSSATQTAINSAAGTSTIFPSINDQNASVTDLVLSNAQFSDVSMASGYLVLQFTNRLPVSMDIIRINLYNTSPFQSLIGQLVFSNVPPNGGTKRDSLNLTGVTLSSSLGYSLPLFRTYASSSPVVVNLNDYFQIDVTTNKLKAYAGNAVFPDMTINPQSLNVDFKTDDSTVKIRNVAFESGLINYSIKSTIDERLDIKISIPGATKNSLPFAPIVLSVNNETKTGTIDVSDVIFDLTQDLTQPYNKIKVLVEPAVVSSNQIKAFDSSNNINASFAFETLTFKELNGYLGNQVINIDTSNIDVGFLDQFSSGFPLDDPKIKIMSSNSIGVPIQIKLDVEGKSASSGTQSLNAAPFTIPFPTQAQKGQVIKNTQTFDKSNSSLVTLLNLPPKTVVFGGKATLNPAGFTGYNDFITKNGSIVVGYEIAMPLSLKTSDFVIQPKDTANNPFFKVNEDGTLGDFSMGDIKNVDYLELITKIENGIPFGGKLYLYFADKNGVISDSTGIETLLVSAIPDATGKTVTPSLSLGSLKLTNAMLQNMKDKNLSKMIVKVKISTYANGSQPVKIYSTYKIRIGLTVKIKGKYALGGK